MKSIAALVCFTALALYGQVQTLPSDAGSSKAVIDANFTFLNGHLNGVAFPPNVTAHTVPVYTASGSIVYLPLPTCSILGFSTGSDSFQCFSTATPSAHAATHAANGSDPLTLTEAQITNLGTDLGLRAPLASPTFTGTLTLPITGSTQCLHVNSSGTLSGTGSDCGSVGGMIYPGAGIGVSTGSAWGTSLTAPTGTIVGTTDTQTLTNKTVNGVAPATFAYFDPTSSVQTQLNAKAPLASPTFTGTVTLPAPTLNNITGSTQCLHVNSSGVVSGSGSDCGTASGMIYPGAGVPNSTGSAWGTSYTVGTGTNNLVQLDGSSRLPAVNGSQLTNLPAVTKAQSPLTTKGDLWVTDGTSMHRLGAGSDGQILTVDSAQTDGVKWATGAGGGMVYPGAGVPNSTGSAWGTSYTFDADGTLTANSDTKIASQKAVKTYVDAHGGTGIVTMTTGAGAPVSNCTAPSSSNLAAYTNTTTSDVWICPATNTWKKLLSTADTGTYTVTGGTGTAPSNPASGSVTCYFDSATNNQICLDSSGNAFTMVKADTGATNNFLTAISAGGIISKARPTCANLSDSSGGCSMSTTAGGDLSGTLPSPTVTATHLSSALPAAQGGTGIAYFAVAGPTAQRTYTFPDASVTIPQVIGSGQTAMPTSSVSANTCDASSTTATATGALTTDVATATYAADPTGVTGYGGGTGGGITIRWWITSNTINFKRCNETTGSITPGALSINWRIPR